MPPAAPGGHVAGTGGATGGHPPEADVPAARDVAGQAQPARESGTDVPGPVAAAHTAAVLPDAGGRALEAAGLRHSAAENAGAVVRPQPQLEATVIGLGVGLVGLAATAGAVYFRIRRP